MNGKGEKGRKEKGKGVVKRRVGIEKVRKLDGDARRRKNP